MHSLGLELGTRGYDHFHPLNKIYKYSVEVKINSITDNILNKICPKINNPWFFFKGIEKGAKNVE